MYLASKARFLRKQQNTVVTSFACSQLSKSRKTQNHKIIMISFDQSDFKVSWKLRRLDEFFSDWMNWTKSLKFSDCQLNIIWFWGKISVEVQKMRKYFLDHEKVRGNSNLLAKSVKSQNTLFLWKPNEIPKTVSKQKRKYEYNRGTSWDLQTFSFWSNCKGCSKSSIQHITSKVS